MIPTRIPTDANLLPRNSEDPDPYGEIEFPDHQYDPYHEPIPPQPLEELLSGFIPDPATGYIFKSISLKRKHDNADLDKLGVEVGTHNSRFSFNGPLLSDRSKRSRVSEEQDDIDGVLYQYQHDYAQTNTILQSPSSETSRHTNSEREIISTRWRPQPTFADRQASLSYSQETTRMSPFDFRGYFIDWRVTNSATTRQVAACPSGNHETVQSRYKGSKQARVNEMDLNN